MLSEHPERDLGRLATVEMRHASPVDGSGLEPVPEQHLVEVSRSCWNDSQHSAAIDGFKRQYVPLRSEAGSLVVFGPCEVWFVALAGDGVHQKINGRCTMSNGLGRLCARCAWRRAGHGGATQRGMITPDAVGTRNTAITADFSMTTRKT